MRLVYGIALVTALGFALTGCTRRPFDGPTVEAFNGRVTHNGNPTSFPDPDDVSLKLIHEKGQSFGIPIKPDGTFNIGWMPIGKYSVVVTRRAKDGKGAPRVYNVPDGLTIKEGQTAYTIELGSGWKS
ncbi:hypothetical protein AYO40_01370 [Planctomycetaceae bacterium SCGC AG-212-D15]|nr:hypothetical protein AYO40_01370 [Planctomycetaceae bacterium SCGC AG-212-D15]